MDVVNQLTFVTDNTDYRALQEGACRHLPVDRLGLTGAHWGLPGAEAILRLRALTDNGDFQPYWQFHLQHEYQLAA